MEGKKVKVPDEPSSEVCDLCGRPMVIKVGKYGKFLACSGFPECRGTKRLVYSNDGRIYYTENHYESFTLLYGEED